MERTLNQCLFQWKEESKRKPLILRGARQVGKSYLVRELGESFDRFIELNFEERPQLKGLFDGDLDPSTLVLKLEIALKQDIRDEETLLFFDEIQQAPRALLALRYFYEKRPNLHIIAAGSLLEFALKEVGIPVGRVRSLYVYPMTFKEFLIATDNQRLHDHLLNSPTDQPIEPLFHDQLLSLLGEYMAIGGMPEAVQTWIEFRDLNKTRLVHQDLIDTFRQDFSKYSKQKQVSHVEKVFASVPRRLGKKFIFSTVDSDLRSRELKPALQLLSQAGMVHPVVHSSSNGVPLSAEGNFDLFKCIFLDIGLAQALLNVDPGSWILNPVDQIVNKGALAEAFVGQELLAYGNPFQKCSLFYWLREKRTSKAEVDYVMSLKDQIIPIEVKSGKSGTLKSLLQFLKEKPQSPRAIHFCQRNFLIENQIHTYPLYAVFRMMQS